MDVNWKEEKKETKNNRPEERWKKIQHRGSNFPLHRRAVFIRRDIIPSLLRPSAPLNHSPDIPPTNAATPLYFLFSSPLFYHPIEIFESQLLTDCSSTLFDS